MFEKTICIYKLNYMIDGVKTDDENELGYLLETQYLMNGCFVKNLDTLAREVVKEHQNMGNCDIWYEFGKHNIISEIPSKQHMESNLDYDLCHLDKPRGWDMENPKVSGFYEKLSNKEFKQLTKDAKLMLDAIQNCKSSEDRELYVLITLDNYLEKREHYGIISGCTF
jgi:hypothetical protein